MFFLECTKVECFKLWGFSLGCPISTKCPSSHSELGSSKFTLVANKAHIFIPEKCPSVLNLLQSVSETKEKPSTKPELCSLSCDYIFKQYSYT